MEKVPPVSSSMRELAFLGALAEVGDLLFDIGERELVGVADDGNDQAARAGDGNADVEVAVVDDVGAVHRGVHDGILLQRVHRGLDEEGHEAQPHSMLFLEALLVLLAQLHARAAC